MPLSHIHKKLSEAFTLEELASKRAKRTGKKEALSLSSVLWKGKMNYREQFDEIKEINEVVNSKCRRRKTNF